VVRGALQPCCVDLVGAKLPSRILAQPEAPPMHFDNRSGT